MDHELQLEWFSLVKRLKERIGMGDLDLPSVLFLIGVQELGKGYQKFSKDEKVNLMHIAICTILQPYGYYKFTGEDTDGWPHFDVVKKLPHVVGDDQKELMTRATIEYFSDFT